MKINIKLMNGVEGRSLYLNDTRVSGPKPWGGGKILFETDISLTEFKRALPHLDIQEVKEK